MLLNSPPHNRDEYIVSSKMFKHIVLQAVYQIIIMLIFVFLGPQFLPEYSDSFDEKFLKDSGNPYARTGEYWKVKYSSAEMTHVVNGRLMDVNGTDPMYEPAYKKYDVHSRHFTAIFNVFVMMQLFNFLNSRKIQ